MAIGSPRRAGDMAGPDDGRDRRALDRTPDRELYQLARTRTAYVLVALIVAVTLLDAFSPAFELSDVELGLLLGALLLLFGIREFPRA